MSFPISPSRDRKTILPVHMEIDSTGSSGLMDLDWNLKRRIRIYRVRIGNLTRAFSEAAFYVEGADKTSRSVSAGITLPPHDVWMWEGIVEGSRFAFQVRAVTSDDCFCRIWYEEI